MQFVDHLSIRQAKAIKLIKRRLFTKNYYPKSNHVFVIKGYRISKLSLVTSTNNDNHSYLAYDQQGKLFGTVDHNNLLSFYKIK